MVETDEIVDAVELHLLNEWHLRNARARRRERALRHQPAQRRQPTAAQYWLVSAALMALSTVILVVWG